VVKHERHGRRVAPLGGHRRAGQPSLPVPRVSGIGAKDERKRGDVAKDLLRVSERFCWRVRERWWAGGGGAWNGYGCEMSASRSTSLTYSSKKTATAEEKMAGMSARGSAEPLHFQSSARPMSDLR